MTIKVNIYLLSTIIISCFCVSCGASKYTQCQQLLMEVNRANREVKTLTSSADTDDLTQFTQAAQSLQSSAETLALLKLRAPQLVEYQSDFVKIYQDYAQATLDIIEAREKLDRNLANLALEKVGTATKLEKETGESLQSFCNN